MGTRLDNNLAILYVDRDISLNHPYVNTACLPSCDNQFDFLFSNGTGVRCHVAGWGKDEADGQFQFIQRSARTPALEMEGLLSSVRLSLVGGLWSDWSPGESGAPQRLQEFTSGSLTSGTGSTLT